MATMATYFPCISGADAVEEGGWFRPYSQLLQFSTSGKRFLQASTLVCIHGWKRVTNVLEDSGN